MALATKAPERRPSRRPASSGVSSVLTLAAWRWRQHWFLLLVTALGMIAAVTIVCTAPLLSEVMQTAGLRSVLSETAQSSEVSMNVSVQYLSSQVVGNIFEAINTPIQRHLGAYLQPSQQFEIQTPKFTFNQPPLDPGMYQMSLDGTSMSLAAQHVQLLQGRLPSPTAQGVEVALTPESAQLMGVKVGSIINLQMPFQAENPQIYLGSAPPQLVQQQFKMQVVGLFHIKPGDLFWHGNDFQAFVADTGLTNFFGLVSDQALLTTFDLLASAHQGSVVSFLIASRIIWYYHIDPSRVSINQLDAVINQANALQDDVANTFNPALLAGGYYGVSSLALSGPIFNTRASPGSLEQFRNHLALSSIPVNLLELLMLCLLLFFVSIMLALLVDRQASTILVMLSRGARGRQVYASLVTQCLGLALIALVAGPLLALAVVPIISRAFLVTNDASALAVITQAPWQAVWGVRVYALAMALVAFGIMSLTLIGVFRLRLIASGSASERLSRYPLWRRLNLDLLAALIALVGYGISLYLSGIQGQFDTQTQAQVIVPLNLLAPFFLLLAAILLLLRLFPWLLRLGERLAQRGRGAAPMLALAQISRAPRKSLRMILLLALAVAFSIFTLIFQASEVQHAQDITSYAAGADFSGTLPSYERTYPLPQETSLYRQIAGVQEASVGYEEIDTSSTTTPIIPILVRAVDTGTYGRTADWTNQDSSQSLASLMTTLASLRVKATGADYIPSIVDTITWNQLGLHIGSTFSLYTNDQYRNNTFANRVHYVVVGHIDRLPGLSSGEGGVLVEYNNFATIQFNDNSVQIAPNHVWLRTSDDPALLGNIRATISSVSNIGLLNISDRRALLVLLLNDPLYFNLVGLLAMGAVTALLLTFLGNLLASWLNVRTRLTSFVVLRALGTSTREIAAVLLWEQGIVYATALILGMVFGALLAITAVPLLVFNVVPAANLVINGVTIDVLALQQLLPIQVIVPLSLTLAFAIFVGICLLALVMMIRLILGRSIGQEIRLFEDGRLDFVTREEVLAARTRVRQAQARKYRRAGAPSAFTLLLWRVRRSKFLTALIGVAMLLSVAIACSVPLFSAVTMDGDLHSVLRATSSTSQLTFDSFTQGLSSQVVQAVQQQSAPVFKNDMGNYLEPSVTSQVQATDFLLDSPRQPASTSLTLNLLGVSLQQAASHFSLVQGRMPGNQGDQQASNVLEALLTPETAQNLHVTVGSLLSMHLSIYALNPGKYPVYSTLPVRIQVVGLLNVGVGDAYWLGNDLRPVRLGGQAYTDTLLVSSNALLATFDSAAQRLKTGAVLSFQPFELTESYRLNIAPLTASNLDALNAHLSRLQIDMANRFGNIQNADSSNGNAIFPYLTQATLYNPTPGAFALPTVLNRYRSRIDVVDIPLFMLTIMIIGLLLFFVSLIAHLQVDRQADSLAVLRSRGASGGQILASMFLQSILLGVVAFVLGPLLALFVIAQVGTHVLGANAQDALYSITGHPWDTLLSVGWLALAVVLVAVASLLLALRRAVGMDILAFRREASRATHRPFWQRLRLDMVAIVLAFVGYAITLYLSSTQNSQNAQAVVLIASPLALIAPLFLVLGCILLFLRLYPLLLQALARWASRGRGAMPMLALAQMERAPRYTLRMTVLLALTASFAIFSLVYTASQAQRASDIAAYEAGADFSGDLATPGNPSALGQITALFSHLTGVQSASVGFTGNGEISNLKSPATLQVRAVDASTFAQTAIWTSQDSAQSLDSLMTRLVAGRVRAVSQNRLPVIVDAAAAQRAHLQVGAEFTLGLNALVDYKDSLAGTQFTCVVLAIVQHLPTVNVGAVAQPNDATATIDGGALIDFSTLAGVYQRYFSQPQATLRVAFTFKTGDKRSLANPAGARANLPINHVWLRTQDDPALLEQLRSVLASPRYRLENLYDRRVILKSLQVEPLAVDLLLLLTVGAITTLLLALIGYLLVAWVGVRLRASNFAVLRAIGADPRQVTGLLLLEQGIVYVVALLIGALLGTLLTFTIVPSIIFTDIPLTGILSSLSESQYYVMQSAIPRQLVIPTNLSLAFVLLIVICGLALGLMAWMVLRPSMSQTLRINED